MKKVLSTSVKVFSVLMLVGFFSGGLVYGQDIPEEEPGFRKVKPPINKEQSSQVGASSGDASALKPALAPAKASDTVSPASTAGAISPAQASDTVSPASTAGSISSEHPKAVSPSVRQQRGGATDIPPDAAGR